MAPPNPFDLLKNSTQSKNIFKNPPVKQVSPKANTEFEFQLVSSKTNQPLFRESSTQPATAEEQKEIRQVIVTSAKLLATETLPPPKSSEAEPISKMSHQSEKHYEPVLQTNRTSPQDKVSEAILEPFKSPKTEQAVIIQQKQEIAEVKKQIAASVENNAQRQKAGEVDARESNQKLQQRQDAPLVSEALEVAVDQQVAGGQSSQNEQEEVQNQKNILLKQMILQKAQMKTERLTVNTSLVELKKQEVQLKKVRAVEVLEIAHLQQQTDQMKVELQFCQQNNNQSSYEYNRYKKMVAKNQEEVQRKMMAKKQLDEEKKHVNITIMRLKQREKRIGEEIGSLQREITNINQVQNQKKKRKEAFEQNQASLLQNLREMQTMIKQGKEDLVLSKELIPFLASLSSRIPDVTDIILQQAQERQSKLQQMAEEKLRLNQKKKLELEVKQKAERKQKAEQLAQQIAKQEGQKQLRRDEQKKKQDQKRMTLKQVQKEEEAVVQRYNCSAVQPNRRFYIEKLIQLHSKNLIGQEEFRQLEEKQLFLERLKMSIELLSPGYTQELKRQAFDLHEYQDLLAKKYLFLQSKPLSPEDSQKCQEVQDKLDRMSSKLSFQRIRKQSFPTSLLTKSLSDLLKERLERNVIEMKAKVNSARQISQETETNIRRISSQIERLKKEKSEADKKQKVLLQKIKAPLPPLPPAQKIFMKVEQDEVKLKSYFTKEKEGPCDEKKRVAERKLEEMKESNRKAREEILRKERILREEEERYEKILVEDRIFLGNVEDYQKTLADDELTRLNQKLKSLNIQYKILTQKQPTTPKPTNFSHIHEFQSDIRS